MAPVVVMKFGGTSVATEEGRQHIARKVSDELSHGKRVVLVVSAMGRAGAPYATDTLLGLVSREHVSAHELDILMSTGEIISAVVVSHELNRRGIAARALTGADAGILTDGHDGQAAIIGVDTRHLHALLEAGEVAVVAGFQGMDAEGLLKTLGRGGSDTSACALAVALGAERVDISTDVDGVYTADPRLVEDAQVLARITAEELYQMASHGSKVVHEPAAQLALGSGVTMRVVNTFSDAPGTEVVSLERYRPDAVATAVSTVRDMSRLRLRLPYVKDDVQAHMAAQTNVYRALACAGISIDMFTPMNDRVVFSIASADTEHAIAALKPLGLDLACRPHLGKLTLIGAGMHGVPGVMAQVADCLAARGIDILQVADSHATISLLVDEGCLDDAARALHAAFGLADMAKRR
ncbi:MAG: aspartate kinase [Coriobacteriales bacterium]|jgi:aspartate kinase|nr:aspartate kinase [Coriobacteriales bacterium]